MRKHRFFVSENLAIGSIVTLGQDLSHYISRVLRLSIQAPVYLFNNSGYEFLASIEAMTKNAVTVIITNFTPDTNESPLKIHLAQVLSKGEKMDLVIQKATELGVDSITPLFSERALIKKISDRSENKLEHWQKIAIAASGQCWRNYVPIINAPIALDAWLQQQTADHKLILSTVAASQHLKGLKINTSVSLLIGPEGGFSAAELELALQQGFVAITLGPRILRTETAGIAAIAILQSLFGDC
jgi:16S rRNA (uracil1498-N3)-methyltransferase